MGRYLKINFVLFSLASVMISCGQTENVVQETASGTPSLFNVNMYSMNKLTCDPLGGGSQSSLNTGLKGTLYYLKDDQPRYSSVSDYIQYGQRADQYLFFSQVQVPTRRFNTGFPLETGDVIKVDKGAGSLEPLYEYFAIRYSSVVSLGPEDEEGDYELALLSDDGAILRVRGTDGNYEVAVNNDGDHPTKMGCSSYRMTMNRSTQKLIQLDYYQGPRYHISVIPIWRKVQPGETSLDVRCGQSGNNLFFDEYTSAPKAAYSELLARGWKPLNSTNYNLPESAILNPCANGVAPVISNFTVEDNYDGTVIVRWTTDIPSTSQVKYIESGSGSEQLTESDNVLRTEHTVYLLALKPGATYDFQAVSISESYGKSVGTITSVLLQ